MLHPFQMCKRSPAKFITAFIKLEERYRKQTKECRLQKSLSKRKLYCMPVELQKAANNRHQAFQSKK